MLSPATDPPPPPPLQLYIGSIHAAFNLEKLRELGITHVLNASGLPATFPRSFTYLTVEVRRVYTEGWGGVVIELVYRHLLIKSRPCVCLAGWRGGEGGVVIELASRHFLN